LAETRGSLVIMPNQKVGPRLGVLNHTIAWILIS